MAGDKHYLSPFLTRQGTFAFCEKYRKGPPNVEVREATVKDVPLLLSIIFAHHKKLTELEKQLNEKGQLANMRRE